MKGGGEKMPNKATDCCWCNHPIVKSLVEAYCLVWAVIGIIFLAAMIWGFIQFRSFGANGWGKYMMQQGAQNQNKEMPSWLYTR
jgi:hypothetical protein